MTEPSQAEDMAYFRADLCLYSPESYGLDEKKQICNDTMSTSRRTFLLSRSRHKAQAPVPSPNVRTTVARVA